MGTRRGLRRTVCYVTVASAASTTHGSRPRPCSDPPVPRGGGDPGRAGPAGRPPTVCSAGQRIVNRLRVSLFTAILRQEVAFFDKTHTGELVNRLSADTVLLGRSVTENLSDGLRAMAQASVGTAMMVRDGCRAGRGRGAAAGGALGARFPHPRGRSAQSAVRGATGTGRGPSPAGRPHLRCSGVNLVQAGRTRLQAGDPCVSEQ